VSRCPSISLDPDQPLDHIVNCITLCQAAPGDHAMRGTTSLFRHCVWARLPTQVATKAGPVPTRRRRRTFRLTARVRLCGLSAGITRDLAVPSELPTQIPFASDPLLFELKADPADPPSTEWRLVPGLNAEPTSPGVGRRARIVLKSNF
jgi:hypothetical protein